MAEAKDDPDAGPFVHKIANHLGNSRLEEALNDFLERHSEELRLELGREDSLPSPEETEGLEQEEGQKEAEWGERGGAEQENKSDLEEEGRQEPSFEDGEFSERVHELYREFLRVVTANLEEFVKAEGLSEVQFRDACEKEMQAKDPRGLSFMHALISSWEFSSFVALVSGYLDERAEPGEEDENEGEGGDKDDSDEEESSVPSSSPSDSSRGDNGAEGFNNSSGDRSIGGTRRRSRCGRCSRSSSSSSSSSSGGMRVRRPPSPPAVDVLLDDAIAGDGRRQTPLVSRTESVRDGAAAVQAGRRTGAAAATIPRGLGSRVRIHGSSNLSNRDAAGCCGDYGGNGGGSDEPPGREGFVVEAREGSRK